MKIATSKDGHPAIEFDFPSKLYATEPGEFGITWWRPKDEVVQWLRENIPEGRFQLNGSMIVFLDEHDRFHFMMRWR